VHVLAIVCENYFIIILSHFPTNLPAAAAAAAQVEFSLAHLLPG